MACFFTLSPHHPLTLSELPRKFVQGMRVYLGSADKVGDGNPFVRLVRGTVASRYGRPLDEAVGLRVRGKQPIKLRSQLDIVA